MAEEFEEDLTVPPAEVVEDKGEDEEEDEDEIEVEVEEVEEEESNEEVSPFKNGVTSELDRRGAPEA